MVLLWPRHSNSDAWLGIKWYSTQDFAGNHASVLRKGFSSQTGVSHWSHVTGTCGCPLYLDGDADQAFWLQVRRENNFFMAASEQHMTLWSRQGLAWAQLLTPVLPHVDEMLYPTGLSTPRFALTGWGAANSPQTFPSLVLPWLISLGGWRTGYLFHFHLWNYKNFPPQKNST